MYRYISQRMENQFPEHEALHVAYNDGNKLSIYKKSGGGGNYCDCVSVGVKGRRVSMGQEEFSAMNEKLFLLVN